MDDPPVAPNVAQVFKHNRTLLYRHIATRVALAVVLFAAPLVAHLLDWDAALPAFSMPAGLIVLIFLVLRLRHGSRLAVCEKVLRTYPLAYRTLVSKKGSEWKYLGDVHTVRLSVRGQHGAPYLRAINVSTCAAGRRRPMMAAPGSPVMWPSAAS
ncbi:hypothetical protein ACU639_26370 [Streptomyces cynarae]|uniref:hypothetical protein n=1 Tax=Streptomyces cynarae TaxID=2981134 RepID=UPI00406CAF19